MAHEKKKIHIQQHSDYINCKQNYKDETNFFTVEQPRLRLGQMAGAKIHPFIARVAADSTGYDGPSHAPANL